MSPAWAVIVRRSVSRCACASVGGGRRRARARRALAASHSLRTVSTWTCSRLRWARPSGVNCRLCAERRVGGGERRERGVDPLAGRLQLAAVRPPASARRRRRAAGDRRRRRTSPPAAAGRRCRRARGARTRCPCSGRSASASRPSGSVNAAASSSRRREIGEPMEPGRTGARWAGELGARASAGLSRRGDPQSSGGGRGGGGGRPQEQSAAARASLSGGWTPGDGAAPARAGAGARRRDARLGAGAVSSVVEPRFYTPVVTGSSPVRPPTHSLGRSLAGRYRLRARGDALRPSPAGASPWLTSIPRA